MAINLTTDVCGIKFKNPIVPAAGDIVTTIDNCKNMVQAGVGGIFTKTYSSLEAPRTRPEEGWDIRGHYGRDGGKIVSVALNISMSAVSPVCHKEGAKVTPRKQNETRHTWSLCSCGG